MPLGRSGHVCISGPVSPCAWLKIMAVSLLPGRVTPGRVLAQPSLLSWKGSRKKHGTQNMWYALKKEKAKTLWQAPLGATSV